MTRRQMMMNSLGTIGAVTLASDALAELSCKLTPKQTMGPFYPVDDQLDKDNDLTLVDKALGRPKGDVIYVQGIVTDQNCVPVVGALVEIWQACASGRYNHRGDPNPAPLDPNFQYWGQALTGKNGEYMFKTIIPGAYPASDDWMRPPHIHYKVQKRGYAELVTQLYFKGNKFNDTDLILLDLKPEERALVVADLKPSGEGFEPNTRLATFNISLRKLSR